jgi:hypothetical protein
MIMLDRGGKLTRRRIEQHAYIPYTHGSRRICGGLLTLRRLVKRKVVKPKLAKPKLAKRGVALG